MSDINVLLERLERLLENVHQYVGARYVPNFIDDPWSDTTAYEALDVVDNGSGTSYIAKKPVPVGTPLTDREYWFVYGSSNGAILHLQDQIDAIVARMKAYKSPINRHVVIIGDSYADDTDDFAYIIQDRNIFKQCDLIVGGGRGFTGKEGAAGDTGPELEYLTYFKVFVNGLTQDEKDDIDDVYIIGGFNDHYSTASVILTHMEEFFTWAHANLPANYYLIESGWCYDLGNVTTPQGNFSCMSIRNAIASKVIPSYAKCGRFGCAYLGTTISAVHNYAQDWKSDHYHPNAAASIKIADMVESLMLNGRAEYPQTEFTAISDRNNDRFRLGTVRIIDDVLFLISPGNRFFANVAADCSTHTDVALNTTAHSDERLIGPREGLINYIPCNIQMANNVQYFTSMYIADDGVVHIIAPTDLLATDNLRVQPLSCSFSLYDC